MMLLMDLKKLLQQNLASKIPERKDIDDKIEQNTQKTEKDIDKNS